MDLGSQATDFFVNFNLQTTMKLPNARETVLHFFEAVQKEFPAMTGFYQRDMGEFVLEEDREEGTYRWAELHDHRLCGGFFAPERCELAYVLHRWLLERSIYYLGISGLDVDALDLLYGFNLEYQGNRDGIVAAALAGEGPLSALCNEGSSIRPIEFEPNIVFSLDEDCYLQARINVETRCSSFQVRTGQYEEEPISVYFTLRQYPQPGKVLDMLATYDHMTRVGEDLVRRIVIPQIIQPISEAIAAGQ